ncbi:MAG: hypothetical protein HS116_16230 [Planctomycetes bacterium]|nr:hypothetical protein [Planctomycetota bacterium]
MRRWAFCLLGLALACPVQAADRAPLEALVRDALKAGARPTAYVGVLGERSRVKVSAATAQELTVEVKGNKLPLAWKDLSAADLAQVAQACAAEGKDLLAVSRFCLAEGLPKEAEQCAEEAARKDPSLAAEAGALLAALPKPEATARTVAPEHPEAPNGAAPRKDLAALAGLPPPGSGAAAPGTNHAGRALPPLPKFDRPILFNEPESDAILSCLQIFPPNSPWNEDVSKNPVHPDSAAMIAKIGAEISLHVDFGHNWVFVPPNQPKVEVKIVSYPRESDPGPYPVPANCPIQGWPEYWVKGHADLATVQTTGEGDRHAYVIDPHAMMLYEFFHMRRTAGGWEAGCAAVWDLRSNKLRPAGWTSADAAGCPLLVGIARYDELERGMVEHALRVTFAKTRKEYLYPATHFASQTDDKLVPAMGQRFRLKATANLAGLPKQALAIARGLQKYGMICCDNGRDWDIPCPPDPRIDVPAMKALERFKGSDFEVIQTTGPNDLGRGGAR